MWRALLLVTSLFGGSFGCQDIISSCELLKPICIGSILSYQLNTLVGLANQLDNSSIPALEESLPLIRNGLPLMGSPVNGTDETTLQPATDEQVQEKIIESLPLLKESLPLIRESLPLLRDSLPLIRSILDPIYGLNTPENCKKKSVCKTCRECPKLRQMIQQFVETLCPNTCRTCNSERSQTEAAEDLMAFYV